MCKVASTPHQRFLVARQLAHIDALGALVAELSDDITRRLQAFAPLPEPLDAPGGAVPPAAEAASARPETIPGVG